LVFEGKGFGRREGHTETYRAAEYKVDYARKLMLIVVVDEELVDTTIKAMHRLLAQGRSVTRRSRYQGGRNHAYSNGKNLRGSISIGCNGIIAGLVDGPCRAIYVCCQV
jgi:hypothetical protein